MAEGRPPAWSHVSGDDNSKEKAVWLTLCRRGAMRRTYTFTKLDDRSHRYFRVGKDHFSHAHLSYGISAERLQQFLKAARAIPSQAERLTFVRFWLPSLEEVSKHVPILFTPGKDSIVCYLECLHAFGFVGLLIFPLGLVDFFDTPEALEWLCDSRQSRLFSMLLLPDAEARTEWIPMWFALLRSHCETQHLDFYLCCAHILFSGHFTWNMELRLLNFIEYACLTMEEVYKIIRAVAKTPDDQKTRHFEMGAVQCKRLCLQLHEFLAQRQGEEEEEEQEDMNLDSDFDMTSL